MSQEGGEQQQSAQIQSLNNIVIGAGCQFTTGSFLNGDGLAITLPATASTLATSSDVSSVGSRVTTIEGSLPTMQSSISTNASNLTAQIARFDRLVAYLKNWIAVGNLSMANIEAAVDPPAQGSGSE